MTEKMRINENDREAPVRLNKYLSDAGVCSRREADRLIEAGEVFVDGRRASLGEKVFSGQEVICSGQAAVKRAGMVIIAYNKPAGVECTAKRDNPDNIIDAVGYPERVYPIGRLDKASTGLILLTNTGSIVNKILRSRGGHEKEYLVEVDRRLTDDFLERMSEGVLLKGVVIRGRPTDITTKKCVVGKETEKSFRIILTQGINRQIRRMCASLGYNVKTLRRVRIMNIELGDLKEGQRRLLTKEEIEELLSEIGEEAAEEL